MENLTLKKRFYHRDEAKKTKLSIPEQLPAIMLVDDKIQEVLIDAQTLNQLESLDQLIEKLTSSLNAKGNF